MAGPCTRMDQAHIQGGLRLPCDGQHQRKLEDMKEVAWPSGQRVGLTIQRSRVRVPF